VSAERDETRIVRSWLEEGVTVLPDRVLDAVLDRLPATPQRRARWPARRLLVLNNKMVRIGMASAAVILAAVVGIAYVAPNLGGPIVEPTPNPTATPGTLSIINRPLEAGSYTTQPFSALTPRAGAAARSIRVSFTVPDGYTSFGGSAVVRQAGTEPPAGAVMGFWLVTGLHSDPCHAASETPNDVSVGPTVDDLAVALAQASAYETTTPTDVTLDGFAGRKIDLLLPDSDFSSCDNGHFVPWQGAPWAQGPAHRWHLWILDVDGVRVVVFVLDYATTPAPVQAELQAMVDSIDIEP